VDAILALKLSNGAVAWADPRVNGDLWTLLQPTGRCIKYGTATDGKRIYAAEGDTASIPYTLGGSGPYAGQTITGTR